MPRIHWNIDQGSADWYALRSKIPTASEFGHILTPKTQKLSASRHKYACRIIAGRILNWQADSLDKIQHIADGKANEPLAVGQLEVAYDIETRPVGFVTTNDNRFGASPDRVVMAGDAIGITVECKCPTIPVQFERLLFGNGEEYICQVQGQLWVAEADKALFYSFNPRMPPYMVETGRDEAFIKKLADALEQFSDELDALEERARAAGAYQAFAEILPPGEVEIPSDMNAAAEIARQGNWGG
tara:strand:- start:224 stop:952 length:729 start_codon:yes stop_codon:yes gene_type:complete